DGEPRSGEAAVALGLADLLVDPADEPNALLSAAAERVRALARAGSRRRLSDASPDASQREAFEKAAASLLKARAGEPQIEAIVDCVRSAFDTGFEEGLRRERAHFDRLVIDERSRALRHAFFAERQSAPAIKGTA